MYSERLSALFHSRAHGGRLENATHAGTAGTSGQGPYVQLWLRVADGTVQQASWKTYGCPAAIGCSEALCEWAEGRLLQELSEVTAEAVTDWVEGVPEGKEHCARLAAQACRQAAAD